MLTVKSQLTEALKTVKTILHTTREPNYADEVFHKYNDKYTLVDFMTNTTLAAILNCLEGMGVTPKILATLKEWSTSRSVTLRLKAAQTCSFNRKEEREVSSPERVIETKGILGSASISQKVVTKVQDYFWDFNAQFELFAFKGNNPDEKVTLSQRAGHFEILTSVDHTPKPESVVLPSIDLNITWLLSKIGKSHLFEFEVDRSRKDCHTPRRNSDIYQALSFASEANSWAGQVAAYFSGKLFPVQTNHGLDLSKITDRGIFLPVVPILEEAKEGADDEDMEAHPKSTFQTLVCIGSSEDLKRPSLDLNDLNLFLNEHQRQLRERFVELDKMYPDDKRLITSLEAKIMVSCYNIQNIQSRYSACIDYVEQMLRAQLIAAIGKEITPVDFANYMVFHYRKIFKEEYAPAPFSYAVRRPDRFPDGTIGIDAKLRDGSPSTPIYTMCRRTHVGPGQGKKPMKFPINAATNVSFYGEKYLHAYTMHMFSGDTGLDLELVARARQFSSFLVLIGTIGGPDEFDPKHAFIVQNKDDLKIPLVLEQVPGSSNSDFDPIASLSPEQQRFARAFRSMQLASTVFAVLVLQIKPQLEKLLKIPSDSLTKEIQLSQDILELFMKYQIPSDLLSFDGDKNASVVAKVDEVKRNVKAIQEMIKETEEKELKEAQQVAAYHNPLGRRTPVVFRYESTPVRPPTRRTGAGKTASMTAPKKDKEGEADIVDEVVDEDEDAYGEDFSKFPGILDEKFELMDNEGAMRPTIIRAGPNWSKESQANLLSSPTTAYLSPEDQAQERLKAYDLLDSLTRSGGLTYDEGSLHVVLAGTHCFDKAIIDTVIQDNVNPIEKLESSLLVVGTTIQGKKPAELIKDEHQDVVAAYSPLVFELERKLIAQ